MFDVIQILFWSLTYLLIIFFSVRNYNKKVRAIPLFAVLLNFAWEINALIVSRGFWGHILWVVFDIFIFAFGVITITGNSRRVIYFVGTVTASALLCYVFNFVANGMLISVFIIDLVMAICFWIDRKRLLLDGKVIIAITKLIGDLAAAIFYAPKSAFVFVTGICVLIINVIYLLYCIGEKRI